MKRILVGFVVLVFAAACATSPSTGSSESSGSGGSGGTAAAYCFSSPRWAVGDSLTKGVYGISGWPNQSPAYGHFANLGAVGALARDLVPWTKGEVGVCKPGERPIEIVFAAGINDLASGVPLDQMEANVSDLVQSVGVPVRLLSLQPLPVTSPWTGRDPDRRAFNAWMATTFPTLYTDCSTPLEGPDGWLKPEYDQDGAVHLTNAGEFALSTCVMAGE